MTLDGISASPRGQPAFYEYRYADTSSAEYGAIDKPSFLWAGGMYLGTLYSLMGFRETEWNIGSGDGRSPGVFASASARLEFGASRSVRVTGVGAHSVSLSAGNLHVPSGVFPLDWRKTSGLDDPEGWPGSGVPCRGERNRLVVPPGEGGGLRAVISSFDGHRVRARIVAAPRLPVRSSTEGGSRHEVRKNIRRRGGHDARLPRHDPEAGPRDQALSITLTHSDESRRT
jgi:hypothetical protein